MDNEHHVEDANFLYGVTACGHVDDAGNRQTMSVRLNYFESPEKLEPEDLKTMKFWLYRDDAIAFAAAIIQCARATDQTSLRHLDS